MTKEEVQKYVLKYQQMQMMNAHQENYLQMSDYPELIKNIMQINRRGESQGYNYE